LVTSLQTVADSCDTIPTVDLCVQTLKVLPTLGVF